MEYDFEARCEKCGKTVELIVHAGSCSEHGAKYTHILWPQRKDIVERPKYWEPDHIRVE